MGRRSRKEGEVVGMRWWGVQGGEEELSNRWTPVDNLVRVVHCQWISFRP